MLNDLINVNTVGFINLCKAHQIKTLFAFGSSVNGPFRDSSDVDLVVEIAESDPINKGELLLSLWDKLEKFLNRKVDLLTNDSIRNPILKENIEKTKQLIYDGTKEKVLY